MRALRLLFEAIGRDHPDKQPEQPPTRPTPRLRQRLRTGRHAQIPPVALNDLPTPRLRHQRTPGLARGNATNFIQLELLKPHRLGLGMPAPTSSSRRRALQEAVFPERTSTASAYCGIPVRMPPEESVASAPTGRGKRPRDRTGHDGASWRSICRRASCAGSTCSGDQPTPERRRAGRGSQSTGRGTQRCSSSRRRRGGSSGGGSSSPRANSVVSRLPSGSAESPGAPRDASENFCRRKSACTGTPPLLCCADRCRVPGLLARHRDTSGPCRRESYLCRWSISVCAAARTATTPSLA